jgi:hypothetical protein
MIINSSSSFCRWPGIGMTNTRAGLDFGTTVPVGTIAEVVVLPAVPGCRFEEIFHHYGTASTELSLA